MPVSTLGLSVILPRLPMGRRSPIIHDARQHCVRMDCWIQAIRIKGLSASCLPGAHSGVSAVPSPVVSHSEETCSCTWKECSSARPADRERGNLSSESVRLPESRLHGTECQADENASRASSRSGEPRRSGLGWAGAGCDRAGVRCCVSAWESALSAMRSAISRRLLAAGRGAAARRVAGVAVPTLAPPTVGVAQRSASTAAFVSTRASESDTGGAQRTPHFRAGQVGMTPA